MRVPSSAVVGRPDSAPDPAAAATPVFRCALYGLDARAGCTSSSSTAGATTTTEEAREIDALRHVCVASSDVAITAHEVSDGGGGINWSPTRGAAKRRCPASPELVFAGDGRVGLGAAACTGAVTRGAIDHFKLLD